MPKRAKIGVLISGRGSNMAALLYASKLPDCPYEIVLVAANDPDAPGLSLAASEGVATFARSHKGMPRTDFDAVLDAELRSAGTEYIALAGYMRLLSPEFVAKWPDRILNVHPSLLPKYMGLDTHARAIDSGDPVAGCSVHVVTAELDDGPVLGRIEVAIMPGETPETLAARVLIAEHQLYPPTLAAYVMRERTPEGLLGRLRSIALALPAGEECTSHGTPGFRIQEGKMFAYFSNDHHADGRIAVYVKTSGPDEQAQLIEQDPDLYYRPAYLGPSGWIAIRVDGGEVDWDHIAERIGTSWALVAPRKMAMMREY